jgi:copper oxidase (laccase) domain-containing protein
MTMDCNSSAASGGAHTGWTPPHDWLQPDWPAPANVGALCTTRSGGVSAAPHDSLNLGSHVHDAPAAVQANRARLQAALQTHTWDARPVFLNQVHGRVVAALQADTPDGLDADACTTTAPGVVCTIMVADCLPVLLSHRAGLAVGAAHAGWRGLAGQGGVGVLETLFEQYRSDVLVKYASGAINSEVMAAEGAGHSDAVAADTLAWLGPCIGPQAFEVGAEVRAAFCDTDAEAASCFVARPEAPGKYWCDLAGLARRRLQALGVTAIYGNDSTAPWCTVGNASRFFSYRRDHAVLGGSGRFAACIWRG